MDAFSPFSQLLDLLLPPRCASCQVIVATEKTLCMECWNEARFITAPFCQCCGRPFEYDVPDQAICLDCAKRPPPFEQARCALAYDGFSKGMILAFKHGDRGDLAPTFANWMVRAGEELLEQSDIIIPVPLHWRRLGKRRFNQAGLLSQEITKLSGIPNSQLKLKRVKNTTTQGKLSRIARQKNLQGAFHVIEGLEDKRVLLIDDVLTTGATVLNCTNSLLRAGVSEVRVLTLARVFQHED